MKLMPDAVIYRPHLAIDIARIASYLSDLELQWSIAYAFLLGGQEEGAFAEYYELRDWRKRRRQFSNAAVIRKLPGPLKAEAADLYVEFERLAILRNTIVHGVWAYSTKFDQTIFLAHPRQLGTQINRVFTVLKKMAKWPQRYPQLSVDLR
jgi:hypothetical protein